MLTMAPDRWATIPGRTSRQSRTAPSRLTFTTAWKSSTVTSVSVASRWTPALLTRMSTRPCSSRTVRTTRRTSSSCEMSPVRNRMAPPSRRDLVRDLPAAVGQDVHARDERPLGGEASRDGAADARALPVTIATLPSSVPSPTPRPLTWPSSVTSAHRAQALERDVADLRLEGLARRQACGGGRLR